MHPSTRDRRPYLGALVLLSLTVGGATRFGIAAASSHGTTYWALILAGPSEPNERRVNVLSIFPFVMLMRIAP